MPALAAISKIDFPYRIDQQEVKQYSKNFFTPSFPQMESMLSVFISPEFSVKAIEECIYDAQIKKEGITDIIFVSTAGLSTPGMDAIMLSVRITTENRVLKMDQ